MARVSQGSFQESWGGRSHLMPMLEGDPPALAVDVHVGLPQDSPLLWDLQLWWLFPLQASSVMLTIALPVSVNSQYPLSGSSLLYCKAHTLTCII